MSPLGHLANPWAKAVARCCIIWLRRGAIGVGLCVSLLNVAAQPVQSPYTAQEVGEFIENMLPPHAGMGHVGVALPQTQHIQGLQPALLGQTTLTRIYFGVASDIRQVNSSARSNLRYNNTNLGTVVVSLPLKAGHWGLRIGLTPHTQTNYKFFQENLSAGRPDNSSNHSLSGRGGINRVHLAQGLKLTKGLHIGAELDYYFGAIYKRDLITITGDDATGVDVQSNDRYSHQGLGYTVALHYRYKISASQSVSLGGTFAPPVRLRRNINTVVTRFRGIDRQQIGNGLILPIISDTYRLPLEWRLGLGYQVDNRWALGVDAQRRCFGSSSSYRSSWRLATGVSYVPDLLSLSYFKRLPYRIGFSWEQLPYRVQNARLQDVSTYVGTALVLRNNAQIDFAARLGIRGDRSQAYFERYIHFYVGTTLTSKWFLKKTYN